jgi:hypothetical protein
MVVVINTLNNDNNNKKTGFESGWYNEKDMENVQVSSV